MPLPHTSALDPSPSINHQRFLEALGTHFESLRQLISRVTESGLGDGISTPPHSDLEELLRNIVGNSDRLHDPRYGSVTSCLQSPMMQKSAAEGKFFENLVTGRGDAQKGASMSSGTRCLLATPQCVSTETNPADHPHHEGGVGAATASLPKFAYGEQLTQTRLPVPKRVCSEEAVEKSQQLNKSPIRRNLTPIDEKSRLGMCAVANEPRSRDSVGSFASCFSGRAGSRPSIFSARPSVVGTAALETAFMVLDEPKIGRLDVARIHYVVNQYHALCHEFTIADAGEAVVAICILQHQHDGSTLNDHSSAGIDFPAFSWLLTTGSLGKRITYNGHGKEHGNIMIVLQALRAFCDQISRTLETEEADTTETSKKLDFATQMELFAEPPSPNASSAHDILFSYLPTPVVVSEAKVARPVPLKEEVVVSAVIILYFLLVGVSSDVSPNSPTWDVIETIVKIFFLLEIVYKLSVYGAGVFFCGDGYAWNIFDFMLVIISVVDFIMRFTTTVSHSPSEDLWWLKLARLSRLGRLIRLLRFPMFAEMVQILWGVLSGLRVLFWAFMLFIGFAYILAIVMNNAMTGIKDENLQVFASVYWSLFTVFRCLTGDCAADDGTPLTVHVVKRLGPGLYIGYILTYLFFCFGLLNLIVAVFIEEVKNSAHRRRQANLNGERADMESYLRNVVARMIKEDRYMILTSNEQRVARSRKVADAPTRPMIKLLKKLLTNILRLISFVRGVKAYQHPFNSFFDLHCRDTTFELGDEESPITREVFLSWLSRQDMKRVLDELDVDCNAPALLFDVLDADLSGVLDVREIIEGILNLRGPIQKCDIVATWLSARAIQKQLWDLQEQVAKLVV